MPPAISAINSTGFLSRERSRLNGPTKGLSFKIFHDDETTSVLQAAPVEDRHNRWMVKLGNRSSFS